MNISTSPPPPIHEAGRPTIGTSTGDPEIFPNLDNNKDENSPRGSIKYAPTLGRQPRANKNSRRQNEYAIPDRRPDYQPHPVTAGLLDAQPIEEQGRLRVIWRNKWTLLIGLCWIFPMLTLLIMNGIDY